MKPKIKNSAVVEMIGRSGAHSRYNAYYRSMSTTTIDGVVSDYRFWDEFRRGEAYGYRLSSPMAVTVSQVTASWVWSGGVRVEIGDTGAPAQRVDYTNKKLAALIDSVLGTMLTFTDDVYGLGDGYIVVNPDGRLSFPSPDTVELERDATDWRKIIKATIRTRTTKASIEDIYTEKKRTVIVRYYGDENTIPYSTREEYDNLIGRIPVIHFPCDRGSNELFGRPIYEALLHVFARYDDLLSKALDGAELMGNPMPTFEGLKNVTETIENVTSPVTEEIIDEYDTGLSERRIDWDKLPALFLGEGGSFKFSAPNNGFTSDIRDMLKSLFYLILDRSRLPEVVWGNQVDGARATATEQMKTFYMYIEGRRLQLEGEGASGGMGSHTRDGLHQLFDVWLRTMRLLDRNIVVAPVNIRWSELSSSDKNLQFQWTQWLYDKGLLPDVEALSQSELVEDPHTVLQTLRKDAPEGDVAQVPTPAFDVAQISAMYRQHLQETRTDDAVIGELIEKQRQRIAVSEAIQATRLDFEAQVEDILDSAIDGSIDRRRFSVLLRNAIAVASRKAYLDGLNDGGIENAELESDDIEWLERHIAEQSQYVTNLGASIYKDGKVTPDEIDGRATMWYNKSVSGAYYAGLASASTNSLYEWVLGNAEHCVSCQRLSGQRRRLSFWQRTVLPKSSALACKGYLCKCSIVPTQGKASKGRLPNWRVSEHTHDHEVIAA